MKPLNLLTSACRYCRFYQPEGRRGGNCLSLGVSVQGSWKACTLAKPPFTPTWEGLEGMMKWSGRGQLGVADAAPGGFLQENVGDKEMGGQGDGGTTWAIEEERDLAKI